jgi:transcription elongation GreA/GreB family factor
MLNRIKAMWARLWRRRRPTSEREFHDQREASRYRSEAEARGHWNPPGGDSM